MDKRPIGYSFTFFFDAESAGGAQAIAPNELSRSLPISDALGEK
jgi:hypothetical protein